MLALRVQRRQDVGAPSDTWRTFCAIELPAEASSRASRHIEYLRKDFPNIHASWNRGGKFHLTLKFLGEISRDSVAKLSEAASRSVQDFSPFKIAIEQTGVFPKIGPPRVLWIGASDKSGKLVELHARLEDECAKEGFAREDHPFHPHLTLARLRKPRGARTLAAAHREIKFEPVEVSVSELLVVRSELSSEGSNYTTISRHLLEAKRK
jgi:2'-5' RNA ligase